MLRRGVRLPGWISFAEQKKAAHIAVSRFKSGGESGIRTPDLRIMIPSL
jgi:hypothetical protein